MTLEDEERFARAVYAKMTGMTDAPNVSALHITLALAGDRRANANLMIVAGSREVAAMTRTIVTEETAELRRGLVAVLRFMSEVGGATLGLAMSTNHPDPDRALMDIFSKSQTLLGEWRHLVEEPANG